MGSFKGKTGTSSVDLFLFFRERQGSSIKIPTDISHTHTHTNALNTQTESSQTHFSFNDKTFSDSSKTFIGPQQSVKTMDRKTRVNNSMQIHLGLGPYAQPKSTFIRLTAGDSSRLCMMLSLLLHFEHWHSEVKTPCVSLSLYWNEHGFSSGMNGIDKRAELHDEGVRIDKCMNEGWRAWMCGGIKVRRVTLERGIKCMICIYGLRRNVTAQIWATKFWGRIFSWFCSVEIVKIWICANLCFGFEISFVETILKKE